MMNRRAVRRNVNRFADGLVASYCKGCGLLIAASPRRKTLDVMEDSHQCPVYFHYEQATEEKGAAPRQTPIDGTMRLLVYLR
jgi:hypothetical protein